MRPRFLLSLIAAALLVAEAPIGAFVGPAEYHRTVSATDANTAVTFGFKATQVLIVSAPTSDACNFTLAGTVATTSSPTIKAGEFFDRTFPNGVEGLGIICPSTKTASMRVYAWH